MENRQAEKKIGVLLTNLGTPDAPTTAALRRYLAEFLWDPRVVDIPRPLWWLILHGVILRVRPSRSARAYQGVWSEGGSPLLVIGREQQCMLQQQLDRIAPERYRVELGMRYGNPSIATALESFQREGISQVTVLPLYPQNSCSTTASTLDAIGAALKKRRNIPHLNFIADYHDDSRYIEALAESVRAHREGRPPAEKLLISFHGTPQRFREEGDPYYAQCRTTAERLAAELGLNEGQWLLTFQSRFGREPWLQPYTDKTLEKLAGEGVKSVEVICPGFSADCLETLEEIEVENREIFMHAGGEAFFYIPALNARDDHIAMMVALVTEKR
ncbi:MAG: ferrochelatase [Gammaproteobacteria bacterium]|nr:ferrochelatase [Gammaproteobacteria bacterium]MCW8839515.1 ferrochelatase [Gammaproteobacteria bacterium]MCW8959606.1 ferrochelatase [Gammaproteobacteria bacterium]MCW8973468.1 ferrochelatase [Gammaproteobacteria bacterium]MCW8994102.1 ferrochelatase [Gammaproteobacteria bacterium]